MTYDVGRSMEALNKFGQYVESYKIGERKQYLIVKQGKDKKQYLEVVREWRVLTGLWRWWHKDELALGKITTLITSILTDPAMVTTDIQKAIDKLLKITTRFPATEPLLLPAAAAVAPAVVVQAVASTVLPTSPPAVTASIAPPAAPPKALVLAPVPHSSIGLQNPGLNRCYFNATLKSLVPLHSFLPALQARKERLEHVLELFQQNEDSRAPSVSEDESSSQLPEAPVKIDVYTLLQQCYLNHDLIDEHFQSLEKNIQQFPEVLESQIKLLTDTIELFNTLTTHSSSVATIPQNKGVIKNLTDDLEPLIRLVKNPDLTFKNNIEKDAQEFYAFFLRVLLPQEDPKKSFFAKKQLVIPGIAYKENIPEAMTPGCVLEYSFPPDHPDDETLGDFFTGFTRKEEVSWDDYEKILTKSMEDQSLGDPTVHPEGYDAAVENLQKRLTEKGLIRTSSGEQEIIDNPFQNDEFNSAENKSLLIPFRSEHRLSETAPDTVAIQLKRFTLHEKIHNRVKVPTEVDIPYETREGKPPRQPEKYLLRSVVIHRGDSISSGHYYSYTCEPDLDHPEHFHWYLHNDRFVQEVRYDDIRDDIEQNTYLVQYERASLQVEAT